MESRQFLQLWSIWSFPRDCLKQKQKQKSFKVHYHAKRAEKQENTDSERNTVVP